MRPLDPWDLIDHDVCREWEISESQNFLGKFAATSGEQALSAAVAYILEEAQLHYEHGHEVSCDLHARCKATDERVRQRVKTRVPEGMPDRELY